MTWLRNPFTATIVICGLLVILLCSFWFYQSYLRMIFPRPRPLFSQIYSKGRGFVYRWLPPQAMPDSRHNVCWADDELNTILLVSAKSDFANTREKRAFMFVSTQGLDVEVYDSRDESIMLKFKAQADTCYVVKTGRTLNSFALKPGAAAEIIRQHYEDVPGEDLMKLIEKMKIDVVPAENSI